MLKTSLELLQNTLPFDLLPEDTLLSLSTLINIKEIPADTIIYQQNQSSLQELSIIATGEVEKYFEDELGRHTNREIFRQGDTFGSMSLMLNNQKAIRTVKSITPTTLFQLSKAEFERLLRTEEAFFEYFSSEFGRRMLSGGYAAMLTPKPDPTTNFQKVDLAFSLTIRELCDPQVHTAHQYQSIQEVARSMAYFKRNYTVIMDGEEPVGMVTDYDLREKVVAEGRPTEWKVATIMSKQLHTIGPDAKAYEAILKMFHHKIHHLIVQGENDFFAVVELDRLLHGQGTSPFMFLHQIGQAAGVEELKERWQKVPAIIQDLQDRGAKPQIVNQIVSSISDAIAVNVIERSIRVLGPPPTRFVFMALGSEGRREQTLSTDQDNALIYDDVEPGRRETVREYFLKLGSRVSEELSRVGFEFCPGGLMASNSKWNHSLSHWKDRYTTWVAEPTPENVMVGATFFDCRAIYGSSQLWAHLRSHILDLFEGGGNGFLMQLSKAAMTNRPPLTFFRNLLFEKTEEKKSVLNLKRAMQVISDFARINALHHRVESANTGERLLELRKKEILMNEEYLELEQAFFYLMNLRLRHQAHQMTHGIQPDNHLSSSEITQIEKVTLRQIMRLLESYQKRLALVYTGGMG